MAQTQTAPSSARIVSLDALRGLNVLVMLFVNDLAGIKATPAWLKHIFPPSADGMTFVDVVFPAFLFIAGMSIPIALDRRRARGESRAGTWRHVLSRTASLLLIGVLMINAEGASAAGWLKPPVWTLLMYLGVALVWMAPTSIAPHRIRRLRWIGWLLLAALALAYRGSGAPALIELRPGWWGILGLIGFAYLVTAIICLLFPRSALALAAAIPLLYCFFLADGLGAFGSIFGLKHWIATHSVLGSHAAVTASGALLGLLLTTSATSHDARLRTSLWMAALLGAAALMLHSLAPVHRFFIYNKIAATPPWCLLSSAYTAWIFAICYWLIDMRGLKRGTRALAAAGQNALFAYLVEPIVAAMVGLSALAAGGFNLWRWLGPAFPLGLARPVLFAVGAIAFTAFMQRRGLALKV